MIAKLTGKVDTIGPDWAIIDVNGVGYLASCSRRTLSALGAVGSPAKLLTEVRARDELPHLYGFADASERDWFRLLTTVQGVGAKVALSILSVTAAGEVTSGYSRAGSRRAGGRRTASDQSWRRGSCPNSRTRRRRSAVGWVSKCRPSPRAKEVKAVSRMMPFPRWSISATAVRMR